VHYAVAELLVVLVDNTTRIVDFRLVSTSVLSEFERCKLNDRRRQLSLR